MSPDIQNVTGKFTSESQSRKNKQPAAPITADSNLPPETAQNEYADLTGTENTPNTMVVERMPDGVLDEVLDKNSD